MRFVWQNLPKFVRLRGTTWVLSTAVFLPRMWEESRQKTWQKRIAEQHRELHNSQETTYGKVLSSKDSACTLWRADVQLHSKISQYKQSNICWHTPTSDRTFMARAFTRNQASSRKERIILVYLFTLVVHDWLSYQRHEDGSKEEELRS